MSNLPKEAFTLTGGCFCKAIGYTISIPPLSERPKTPSMPQMEIVPPNEVSSHMPMVSLDHCTSCRRAPGTIVECWLIIPQSWISFSFLTIPASSPPLEHITPQTISVLKGEKKLLETTYLRHYEGNKDSNRTFCGRCGTHVSFYFGGEQRPMSKKAGWGPICDVPVGTLDQDGWGQKVKPGYRAWVEEGIPWVRKLLEEGQKSLSE
ncbi:hypothetical protein DL98DRAFT_439009 [Cadophora sp. DSE1049]|nr:hypothetical protein DL98DRAFT_439009 [Cadophora sp. DSE1049]